jgi:hypothetical protein
MATDIEQLVSQVRSLSADEQRRLRQVLDEQLASSDPLADILDWDAYQLAATEGDESVSLQEVQQALSKIPGSMADVVSAERDER